MCLANRVAHGLGVREKSRRQGKKPKVPLQPSKIMGSAVGKALFYFLMALQAEKPNAMTEL
jgi:hypothetical protein